MRAMLCRRHGPPETLVLEDIPSLKPGKGEVVVQVKAAGVNFHDTLIIQNLYQHKPELPFSPGADLAGTVKEVGAGVRGFKPGDPVLGLLRFGGYAEEAIVPVDRLAALPANVDFVDAAAFGLPYTTSYYALKNCARLAPGETLLVLGAAGGLGAAAVQLGSVMGARVIACASSAEKLEICRRLGAAETINYQTEDLRDSVRRFTNGRGVDAVCDPVGGKLAESALRCMAWQGRYLVIGFASGEIPRVALNITLLKGCSILGVSRGQFMDHEPEKSRVNIDELIAWLAAGKLKPVITARYRLDQAREALDDMIRRKINGKAVLIM